MIGTLVTRPFTEAPCVSAAEMAEVDRLAVEEFGITLLQMMEQAGSHLAEVVRHELGGSLEDRSVVVAAGPGNNGGGGLAAARHLMNRGAAVRVVLARPALKMTEAGRHQLASLLAMGAMCCVVTYDLADAELESALEDADVIVDALLGYNILGAPQGEVERLVGFIRGAGRPVVSLDIPTGIDPDTGTSAGTAILPTATMTLGLPKPGLVAAAAAGRVGRLYLADIGLPAALYDRVGLDSGRLFATSRIIELTLPQ